MATYLDLDKCKLLCSCKRTSPLCTLYFCRHCLTLRCPDCVSHEVDSYYCPNCLENMASAEAKMRKHRCGNCFDCPSCGHTLCTRATAVVQAKPDEPGRTTAQKAYFLACGFCRWITRDSGIPDQQQAAGGWQEKTSPHFKRISELIDSYRHLAVQEKEDQEWNKFARKRNYMILLERYPVLNPRLRRYCSSSWTTPQRESGPAKKVVIPSSEAISDIPPFDLDEYINQPLNIDKITNIHQRHLAPQVQPKHISQLEPRPKSLVVKRSMRCRVCEHNLCKSDFNPSSIKFRINLSAIYHVPELRYMIPSPSTSATGKTTPSGNVGLNVNKADFQRRTSTTLVAMKSEPVVHANAAPGQKLNLILTLTNPMHRVTTVSLRQLTIAEELQHLGHLIVKDHGTEKSSASSTITKVESTSSASSTNESLLVSSSGDTPPTPLSTDEQELCFSTVNVILPTEELKLAPRNDIVDCDVSASQNSGDYKDDPKIVAFRRGNKLGINIDLIPKNNTSSKAKTSRNPSLAPVSEEEQGIDIIIQPKSSTELVPLRAAIHLTYDYKNTSTTLLTAAAAAAAAAANKSNDSISPNKSTETTTTISSETSSTTTPTAAASVVLEQQQQQRPPPPPADEIQQIQVIALLDFGHMPVKN